MKSLAYILSAAVLGGCAYAPTDPRSGNNSLSCGPVDHPTMVKQLADIKSQFDEKMGRTSDDGFAVTNWMSKNGDHRYVVVSEAGGNVCISGNYRFDLFIPKVK